MAEWLGSGLQSRLHRFESGRRLYRPTPRKESRVRVEQVDFISIPTRDAARAIAWYRDVLGLQMEMESPGWSQFSLGNGA